MTLYLCFSSWYESDAEIIYFFGGILVFSLGFWFFPFFFFYTKSIHSAKFGSELEQGRGKVRQNLKLCFKSRGESTTAATQV